MQRGRGIGQEKATALWAALIKQHKNVFGKRRSLRAMPFLRFAGHSAWRRGVFPQGHRRCQSAVPYVPLTYPAREHTPPLPCHLGQ